ncbi:MAG: hypothetical protein ACKO96_36390, partial [Flammeovirgaceae bacterium]
LNEIWRFLSHEIDKRNLIEEKLLLIEEKENELSGSEDEPLPAQKAVHVRSTSQVQEKLRQSIQAERANKLPFSKNAGKAAKFSP